MTIRKKKTTYVATTAPSVPTEMIYALVIARTPDDPELLMPQLKKPGPFGKAPSAMIKIAAYFVFGLSVERIIA